MVHLLRGASKYLTNSLTHTHNTQTLYLSSLAGGTRRFASSGVWGSMELPAYVTTSLTEDMVSVVSQTNQPYFVYSEHRLLIHVNVRGFRPMQLSLPPSSVSVHEHALRLLNLSGRGVWKTHVNECSTCRHTSHNIESVFEAIQSPSNESEPSETPEGMFKLLY